jgi:O-antigen/teichoic acid export membrane protein
LSEITSPDGTPGSRVRLRFASLVMYILSIGGVLFSLYFVTLLTRRLSVEEYGVWVMITRYASYFIIPSAIYSYWLSRNISRGNNTSRTGLYSSIIMGITAIPFYLVLIQMISREFEQPLLPLMISAGFVFFDYIGSSLGSMSGGHSPQITGYANFAFKVGQAISGWLFVGLWSLGLTGGVIAALIGRIILNFLYLIMNHKLLKQSVFKLTIFASWLKTSWLPLFNSIVGMLYTFDVIVVRALYGNEVPVAFYGVATSILSVVLFASAVISSLYPKILSKGNLDDLREAIWLTLFLTMPVICIILFYAQPLCAIFGLKYVSVAVPLQLFAIASFIQLLASLAGTSYVGLEKADENVLLSRILLRSAIFKSTVISFFVNIVYIVLVTVISFLISDVVVFVSLWGIISAISYALSFVFYILLLKRDFSQHFPFKILAKDLIIFILPMAPAFIPLMLFRIEIVEGFYQMFQNLFVPVILSFVLYFVSLYVIDKKFRITLRDSIRMLTSHS